jgi:transposase
MTKAKRDDPKPKALRASATLNPHPEKVTDELFLEHGFFDPSDLVQVKYEMLRRVRVEGQAVSRAARSFGLSRPTFYKAQAEYERAGLVGLLPARRGPRRAHKLSEPVMAFVAEQLAADESQRLGELARRIEERFGLQVHPRSIERALARRQKKTE